MKEYVIRTRVEYVLCVEADTEEDAQREAAETAFNDWEQFPSEEYDVQLNGEAQGRNTEHAFVFEISLEPANNVSREQLEETLVGALRHLRRRRDAQSIGNSAK